MSPLFTAGVIAVYFLLLLLIGRITAGKADNKTFFTAGRNSPWYLIAFGMIGTSISGVTFISVPGEVYYKSFSYLQLIMGNFFGYLVIIFFLLPLYYKLNLVSIYTYLDNRFGKRTHKTGAFFFLLSRTIGAAARLYLVALVFQTFIFDAWGFPFEVSVIISIGLIMLYSLKGGIKTIIYTDALQTLFLVGALIFTFIFLSRELGGGVITAIKNIAANPHSKIFFTDFNDKNFFLKQFISGVFITIAMTGLDQDLMQKNLTCKSLKEAQKNMFVFSFIFMLVVLLFLCLGVLMYIYASQMNIALPLNAKGLVSTDNVFPMLALKHFPVLISFIFIVGLTAASFASADSALTALTTSYCIDFLNFKEDDSRSSHTRHWVHIAFAVLIILIIFIFRYLNDASVIQAIFKIAGYTYGPLLGLFAYGIFTKKTPDDKWTPYICFAAPLLTWLIEYFVSTNTNYKFGFETLIINSLLIFIGLSTVVRKIKT